MEKKKKQSNFSIIISLIIFSFSILASFFSGNLRVNIIGIEKQEEGE